MVPASTAAPPSSLPAVGVGDHPPANRDELGRWVKGQSGNAQGKPKGLKNYITRERMAMEAALRSYMSGEGRMERVLDSIDRMFAIMESGEDKTAVAAFKALIGDKLLTSPKDVDTAGDGPANLTVIISRADGGDAPPVRVIDSTADEVDEPA